MSLEIPTGQRCFVDASILVYHVVEVEPFSRAVWSFLRRVAIGEVRALTTSVILSEALHKIMLAEVTHRFPEAGRALPYVQRHLHIIKQLTLYPVAAERIGGMGIQLLTMGLDDWKAASGITGAHSLLTNDASVVAVMHAHGITHLVTNDDDFDRVPGITLWKPR